MRTPEEIRKILKDNNISGYRLEADLGITQVGADKFLNGTTKKPYKSTLKLYNSYINNGFKPIKKDNSYIRLIDSVSQNSDAKIVDDEDEADIFINKNDVKFMIYSDDTIKVEVDMMPFRAYASSEIDCYFDKEYRENEFNKAIFSVDKVARGLYLGFKSQNESMNGGGINDTPSNAELLCRELGRHLWKNLHNTEYGFVLMTKTSIRHKDITNYNEETGMFTLHSRNPNEEDFEEHINDIHRIFKVIKRTF